MNERSSIHITQTGCADSCQVLDGLAKGGVMLIECLFKCDTVVAGDLPAALIPRNGAFVQG